MLFSLGLEEDQEKKLMELGSNASVELAQNNKETSDLDSELGLILTALYEQLEIEKENR